jgi:hypothetical protein
MSRLGGLIALSLVLTVQPSAPQEGGTPRNFVLLFDVLNYTRDAGDAVTFFFTQVLAPDDQLMIYTPARLTLFQGHPGQAQEGIERGHEGKAAGRYGGLQLEL